MVELCRMDLKSNTTMWIFGLNQRLFEFCYIRRIEKQTPTGDVFRLMYTFLVNVQSFRKVDQRFYDSDRRFRKIDRSFHKIDRTKNSTC